MKNISMEIETKTENNVTKKHIAKLHERIQNKYEEMQRKLEKSKSTEILVDISDNYLNHNKKLFTSVCDLTSVDDKLTSDTKTISNSHLKNITYLDKQNDAILCDILYDNINVNDSKSILTDELKYDGGIDVTEENEFFSKNFLNTSLESLNEVTKESDESSEPVTPPTKSIRDRINSKLKKRKESRNKIKEYFLTNSTKYIAKVSKRNKIATVTLGMVEVKLLEESDEDKQRILLFKFRLGSEKRKSKIVRTSSSEIKFQELFTFDLYDDDYILEVSLWDRDIFIGRQLLNLQNYDKEKTHQLRVKLEGEYKNIECFLLVTISGTSMNTVYDVGECDKIEYQYLMQKKYAWYRLNDEFTNVGVLSVIVYGAKGLSSQDSYCVLQLNNERIQTQTDWKTYDPSWMKIITFKVTDITSTLEVIIYDEKKSEEVGAISIPLLKIEPGKKWFALKDSTLKEKAKGNNPRILLEMYVTWNLIKAATRAINPKEVNYLKTEEKLTRHVFAKNLSRAKVVTLWILDAFRVTKTCFEWESWRLNVVSLFVWIIFCLFGKIWMLPLLLLIPFYWYRPKTVKEVGRTRDLKDDKCGSVCALVTEAAYREKYFILIPKKITYQYIVSSLDEDKAVSLRQKIQSLQEMVQSIQNLIGNLASAGESIKNLFNFTVPFLSFLAIFFIIVIAFVMYLVPFNYMCLIWGVHKFTRKLLRPNRVPNNEILDLLSRVPDDDTLMACEELPLADLSEDDEMTLKDLNLE